MWKLPPPLGVLLNWILFRFIGFKMFINFKFEPQLFSVFGLVVRSGLPYDVAKWRQFVKKEGI